MTSFQLHIVDLDTGLSSEIALIGVDQEVLGLQVARCVAQGGLDCSAQWLGRTLTTALPDAVDYDFKSPSEAQVNFAMVIARALRSSLTPEILRYRGAMHEFISMNKAAFDVQRLTRKISSPTVEAPAQETE